MHDFCAILLPMSSLCSYQCASIYVEIEVLRSWLQRKLLPIMHDGPFPKSAGLRRDRLKMMIKIYQAVFHEHPRTCNARSHIRICHRRYWATSDILHSHSSHQGNIRKVRRRHEVRDFLSSTHNTTSRRNRRVLKVEEEPSAIR